MTSSNDEQSVGVKPFELDDMKESKEVSSNELYAAVYNVTKNGLGICALFAGAGLHSGGMIVGLLFLVIMCIACGYTFYYIGICCGITKTNSYKQLFERAFGSRYGLIIPVCMFLVTYTIISIYMMAIGIFASEFTREYIHDFGSDRMNSGVPMLTIGLIVATPFAFLRSIDEFQYGSLLGLVTLTYVGLLHFGAFVTGRNDRGAAATYALFPGSEDLISSFGFIAIMGQAFGCHYNAPNFYNQVRQNDQAFATTTKMSFGLMLLINACIAVFGYLNFGKKLFQGPPSIFLFFDKTYKEEFQEMEPFALIGGFLVSLNLAVGFGLTLFPTRVALNEFYQYLINEKLSGTEMSYQRRFVLTSIICAVVILQSTVCVYYKGFEVIVLFVNIATCVFCTPITFIFPCLIYLRIRKPKEQNELMLCYGIILLGIMSGVTGMMNIVQEVVNKYYN